MRETEFSGMEYFGSRPDCPKDVCLEEVRRSDLYVGIFANRYGYIEPESGLSMTELEYRQARANELPCLIYILDKSLSVGEEQAEDGGRGKLAALKEELKRDHVVTFFRGPDQLTTHVVIDLHNFLGQKRSSAAGPQADAHALYECLSTHFDLEEIKTVCFQLGVEFDDLRGEGKSAKARELTLYAKRRGLLDKLAATVKAARPECDER